VLLFFKTGVLPEGDTMEERNDCIFCRIADGKMKSNILYQDDEIVAFPDINPLAPVHILIVPREHIASLAEMSAEDTAIIGGMAKVANQLAKSKGIAENGYRLVINCGREGGQGVDHLHMHLLGGRQLGSKLG
jgi:histidine triad (HIT) family protein